MDFYDSGNTKEQTVCAPGIYNAVLKKTFQDSTGEFPKMSCVFDIEENDKSVWQNFTFNEKGQKFISWQMGAIGILEKAKKLRREGETPEQTAINFYNSSLDFIGKRFEIEVTNRVWQGKTYASAIVLRPLDEAKEDHDEIPF